MAVIDKITSIIGGNVLDGVAKIITLFKVPPEVAMQNATELAKIQADLTSKTTDAITAEINQGGQIITTEANSQSWLARNVRPFLLLVWGLTLTLHELVPIVARFWIPDFSLTPLPDWIFKLTAIGFTGYVTARTWEKVTDSDK